MQPAQDRADEQQSHEVRSGEGAESALQRMRELERRNPDGPLLPTSIQPEVASGG